MIKTIKQKEVRRKLDSTLNQEGEERSAGSYTIKTDIKQSPFRRSKVDIIIPFHNNQDNVSLLVQSIIMSVRSNPYRITIVDDGSRSSKFTEELKDFDKDRPKGTLPILQTIRSENNCGFGASINLALTKTENPWVLVMHSDCLVEEPNFMYNMGRSLLKLKEKNVRLVTAKTNKLTSAADPRTIGEKFKYNEDIILEDTFAPLFCFMVHRELFKRIGPIKNYPYSGYEDEEFYYRMKFYGFKQAICGSAWVKHEGSGTMKEILKNESAKLETEKNRDRCIEDLRRLYSQKR